MSTNKHDLVQEYTTELLKQPEAQVVQCACVHGAQRAHAQQEINNSEIGNCNNEDNITLYSCIITEEILSSENVVIIVAKRGPVACKSLAREKSCSCAKAETIREKNTAALSGPGHVATAERSS